MTGGPLARVFGRGAILRRVTEVDVTTIAVPEQAGYDEAGSAFDGMAKGLLAAADLTRNLHFQPGTFAEAEQLQHAVDQFAKDRQDVLEIYSEACAYIGEIVRLCGEAYTGSEKERVDKGSTLETRLGTAVTGLQRLHRKLDEVRSRSKQNTGSKHPPYRADGGKNTGMTYTPGAATGPGPEVHEESKYRTLPAPAEQYHTLPAPATPPSKVQHFTAPAPPKTTAPV